jgi:hypothetical protein
VSGPNRFRVSRDIAMDGNSISGAGIDFDANGQRAIEIRFSDSGARVFETITKTNIGRQLVIVFRGKVLSVPVIRSAIPSGYVQVTGNIGEQQIHEIVDDLNHSEMPAAKMWWFSPVQEQVLRIPAEPDAGFGWLDLDSGVIATNSTLDWMSRSGYAWILTNGFDIVATKSSKDFPTLLGFDLILDPAPTNGWEIVSAADVMQNWSLQDNLPRQEQAFGAVPGHPDTFFFRTREGKKGILQIIGFTENSLGVKIRYKLVQSETK